MIQVSEVVVGHPDRLISTTACGEDIAVSASVLTDHHMKRIGRRDPATDAPIFNSIRRHR